MLSKALRIVPVARRAVFLNSPSVTAAFNRLDHHGPPPGYKFPTMDDMLIPCGCWQEDFDNKQRKYNLHLLLGVGFFIITLAVGKFGGFFEFYVLPPERPLDRESLDLTCE